MKVLFITIALSLLASCASQTKKEVQAEVSQETAKDKQSLGQTIHDQIANSKSLSEDQKSKLVALLTKNKATAEKLSEESYQSRAVLIKELLSPNMSSKKVSIIKSSIKKIEAAKVKNTFDTAEAIAKIVGKNSEHSDAFAEHLMIFDRPSRNSK